MRLQDVVLLDLAPCSIVFNQFPTVYIHLLNFLTIICQSIRSTDMFILNLDDLEKIYLAPKDFLHPHCTAQFNLQSQMNQLVFLSFMLYLKYQIPLCCTAQFILQSQSNQLVFLRIPSSLFAILGLCTFLELNLSISFSFYHAFFIMCQVLQV